jgi:ribosome biogenesis protein Nip4
VKAISDFVAQFNVKIAFDEGFVVRSRNRYYLLSKRLKQQAPKGFFYAGTYLGAVKGNSFFPSFLLLDMIAQKKSNKIVVDKKAAWLFICGRDIFKRGIIKEKNPKKGDHVLILNEYNECLGFGKMAINLRAEIDLNKVAVKNILDIGDFLRREKRSAKRQQKPNRQQTKSSHKHSDKKFR